MNKFGFRNLKIMLDIEQLFNYAFLVHVSHFTFKWKFCAYEKVKIVVGDVLIGMYTFMYVYVCMYEHLLVSLKILKSTT